MATTFDDLANTTDPAKGTSLIGYRLDAAGSSGTTLSSVLQERISVFRFMTDAQIADVRSRTASLDVRTAIQAALNYARNLGGAEVHLPAGCYRLQSTLAIFSNTTLTGEGDGTVLVCAHTSDMDHVIRAEGAEATAIALAAPADTNDVSVTLAANHGAAPGDWYVIKSQRNAMSPDAGEFQLGLPTGSMNGIYFAEPIQVRTVTSGTSFDFQPALLFPGYRPNDDEETPSTERQCVTTAGSRTVTLSSGTTEGLIVGERVNGTNVDSSSRVYLIVDATTFLLTVAATASGGDTLQFITASRPAATVAKITWIENIRIRNLKIIPNDKVSALVFERARDCMVENVHWEMASFKGGAITFSRSLNCEAIGCSVMHDVMPSNEHSASYNTFKVNNGWHCGFTRCSSTNGTQPFDITYTNGGNPCLFTWVNHCTIFNAHDNAFTTHSGSYGFTAIGNLCANCWRGPALRSRNTILIGNTILGNGPNMSYEGSGGTYGVSLMDGWTVDSIVENNKIDNFLHGIVTWDYGAMGQGMHERRVLIANNQIRQCNIGILAVHDSRDKSATMSALVVKDNFLSQIGRYGIWVPSYTNGVEIAGNKILGPLTAADSCGIRIEPNSANHIIRDNNLIQLGAAAEAIYMGNIVDTVTFPFAELPANNGTRTEGNIVQGEIGGSFPAFSYRDIKTVGVSSRRWAHSSAMTQTSERANGNAWVIHTDDASTGSLIFADNSSAAMGQVSYAHSSDTMNVVAAGSATQFGSTYVRPSRNDQKTLGDAAFRWKEVFSVNGTINTSDTRAKQQIASLSNAERNVAQHIRSLIRTFKMNDAVQQKGEAARVHVGVVAQEVAAAFEAEGLDPRRYSLFCYDEWEAKPAMYDEDGNEITPATPAGSSYGIRYDQLLAFVLGAI